MVYFKNLWNNWKAIVDEHNSKITYIDYDNTWGYDMLFYPLINSLLVGLLLATLDFSLKSFLVGFLINLIPMYLLLICLPVALEKKKKKLN